MEKKEVRELPKRIVSDGKQAVKLNEFNILYRNMVSSYAKLPSHLGEEALPKNPKEITEERLSSYIERMTKGLNEEQKKVWQKLYSDAVMQIKAIRQFFETFPSAEFDVNDNISKPREQRITCINKVEAIRAESVMDVPDSAFAYFDKIKAMANALQELRDYEKANGIQQRSVEETFWYGYHAEDFAQKWLGSYFNKK